MAVAAIRSGLMILPERTPPPPPRSRSLLGNEGPQPLFSPLESADVPMKSSLGQLSVVWRQPWPHLSRRQGEDHRALAFAFQTMVLASGGQDGAICLWDMLTGSRVSHMYAHRGDVTSLTCTSSCVISSGLDDLISIWDRTSGIKHYSIQQVGGQARGPFFGPSRKGAGGGGGAVFRDGKCDWIWSLLLCTPSWYSLD